MAHSYRLRKTAGGARADEFKADQAALEEAGKTLANFDYRQTDYEGHEAEVHEK